MSPKKRKSRKPRPTHTTDNAGTDKTGTDTTDTKHQAHAERPNLRRTPVVINDPPDRRITALWVVLATLWALGTPLALAFLLFTVMDLQEALWMAQDPNAPPPQDMLSSIGNALVWVLILALLVPLASAVAATLLRRKIAALGFAAAFTVSALILFLLMPPTELWQALRTHFFG